MQNDVALWIVYDESVTYVIYCYAYNFFYEIILLTTKKIKTLITVKKVRKI